MKKKAYNNSFDVFVAQIDFSIISKSLKTTQK